MGNQDHVQYVEPESETVNCTNNNILSVFLISCASCAGSSSISRRYVDNSFSEIHNLGIGVEYNSKYIKLMNKKIKLNIWDAGGVDSFWRYTKSYVENANIVILCFDVTNKIHMEYIQHKIRDIINIANNDTILVLCGNKCDLNTRRKIYKQDLHHIIDSFTFYIETSAKTGHNIETLFTEASKRWYGISKSTEKYVADPLERIYTHFSNFCYYDDDKITSYKKKIDIYIDRIVHYTDGSIYSKYIINIVCRYINKIINLVNKYWRNLKCVYVEKESDLTKHLNGKDKNTDMDSDDDIDDVEEKDCEYKIDLYIKRIINRSSSQNIKKYSDNYKKNIYRYIYIHIKESIM